MPDLNLANSGESINHYSVVVGYPYTTGTAVEYDGRVSHVPVISEIENKYSNRWVNIDPNTT